MDRTIATGGFSSASLLEQKTLLFEECTINDDGSSDCKKLDDALVDLQDAMAELDSPLRRPTTSAKRLAQNKLNKAALAVRSTAGKFGPAQRKQADVWVQRAISGEAPATQAERTSLLEESVALFGECTLEADGSGSKKCEQLWAAIEDLRVALGDAEDVRGVVVPVSMMTDMEYRKHMAGERVLRPL